MEDSETLAQRVEHGIAASSRTSPTPPGQTDAAARPPAALVEAINQVFALFRLNYHNQYYAAFSEAEQLRQIKKLWLESLRDFPPALILQGARRAIEHSDYLPTLNRMLRCCEESLPELGFPPLEQAYVEASNASHPPESHRWSHGAVYWAGRDCGWQFLATASAPESRPRFAHCYQQRCAAVMAGEPLPDIPAPERPALEAAPLSGEAAQRALRALREQNQL